MVLDLSMSIAELIALFQSNKGWDKQYRVLIQLGKKLPALAASDKVEANEVKGCQSPAWLVIERNENVYSFKMDSDTRVVKGLMAILSVIYQGQSSAQIAALDINELFVQLGLLNHLSPSRSNGLLAIVNRIKEEC